MYLCKLDAMSPASCSHWGPPGPNGNDMQCNGRPMFEGCCPYRECVEEEPPAEEGLEPAEPEVISKGKKEEEPEEEGEKPKEEKKKEAPPEKEKKEKEKK